MNIGNSYKEKMVEQVERFREWISFMVIIFRKGKQLRKDINSLDEIDTTIQ